MIWNLFKKKKKDPEPIDPLTLSLADLKPGYVLDYDLKTYQVGAHHHCEFGDTRVDEWELSAGDGDVAHLKRAQNSDVTYILSRKIRLSDIEGALRTHLRTHDDPPETLVYNGHTYHGESTAVGRYFKNGEEPAREFIAWDYRDETGKRVLSLEQWADDDYAVAAGEIVEEYQFSDILPGK